MSKSNLASPFAMTTPSSASMVRKRTFQDLDPSSPHHTVASSSSPYLLRPSDLHSPHTATFLSSPATLYSSPMGRSASAQSVFNGFTQTLESPEKKEQISPHNTRRPGMKRRRTIAEATASPSSPEPFESPQTPREDSSKNSKEIWPSDVEEAFHTALRLLPRLGRKKILVEGRPCGRNELIGDFIMRHTGKERSRKQVSSHIQVLKNLRKDDVDFMQLVADPIEGEAEFAEGNEALFFGDSGPTSSSSTASFLAHSLSSRDQVYPPPIDLSTALHLPPIPRLAIPTGLNSPFVIHSPHQATTPTTTLTNALRDMTVLTPSASSPTTLAASAPFLPVEITMRAASIGSSIHRQGHTFVSLDRRTSLASRRYLDELPNSMERYPTLPTMIDHLPCQFLHVQLNLDIPTATAASGLASTLESFVRLHTVQALPLTSCTTIFCHGDEIINFSDPLPRATLLNPTAPPTSPVSPSSPSNQHKYSYLVPFCADYWTHVLRAVSDSPGRGSSGTSGGFGHNGRQRFDLAQNLAMFSAVQEFVVPRESESSSGDGISRGSALGDVVLVVAYDFAVCEGAQRGVAELSFLSNRNSAPQPPQHTAPTSTLLSAPPMMRRVTSPPRISVAPHSSMMPPPPLPASTRPHHSPDKPNLSLHIPSPSRFVRRSSTGSTPGSSRRPGPSPSPRAVSGPHTPWEQVFQTPSAPPSVPNASTSPAMRERERLETAWRRTANEWDLNSPALMGGQAAFQSRQAPPSPVPRPSPTTSSFPSPVATFDVGSAFDDAVAFSPLVAASSSFHSSATPPFPSPSFETFTAPLSAPADSSYTFQPSSYEMSRVPDLSSSSGSTTSTSSIRTVDSGTASGVEASAAPVAAASVIDKRKAEADFFSSVFGSSTRYTGVYSS